VFRPVVYCLQTVRFLADTFDEINLDVTTLQQSGDLGANPYVRSSLAHLHAISGVQIESGRKAKIAGSDYRLDIAIARN